MTTTATQTHWEDVELAFKVSLEQDRAVDLGVFHKAPSYHVQLEPVTLKEMAKEGLKLALGVSISLGLPYALYLLTR